MKKLRKSMEKVTSVHLKSSVCVLFAAVTLLSTFASHLVESAPNISNANIRQHHYYGSLIGKLNRRDHNVSGDVYAVDEQTLFIKGFTYDGLAPDAYFWSSVTSQQPAATESFIVPDEKGSTKPLERYLDKDIVLRLPEGKTLREINWLSVWSRQMKKSSGEIIIGKNIVIPRPLEISPLSQLAHGVKSGPITIVDAQTFLVPDFHYDGLGPEGYFWLSRGSQGLSGTGLRLKDENGSSNPLKKYSGETVVISLPDELTIYDFDYFGVWCKQFSVNFGQTKIPQEAKVPPSPKMLGIKPENKLNCEILYDDLGYEIRWVLDGDDIVMQLVGKIEPNEYMAFGLGKDDSKSDMSNADAVVAWVDRGSGQVHAVDYYLGSKQQCTNDPKGSCPDVKLSGGGDSLTLLHGAIVNGYSMVTFKRPQLGIDEQYDQHVYSDGQQSVLWAIGTLNAKKEIGYHRLRTKSNMFIDFARNPQWNCPIPDLNASMHNNLPLTSASQLDPTIVSSSSSLISEPDMNTEAPKATSLPQSNLETRMKQLQSDTNQAAWFIPSIICPSDRTFYAQIGPAGGRRGYEGVTGQSNWGVAWYVNGLMVPELVLERGQVYRFIVEGGNDKTSAARRHPFYLTDSLDGGFDFKTDDERMRDRIFAGVAVRGDGQFVPTAEGRLCEWKQTNGTLSNPDLYPTFAAYQRSLKLDCVAGSASMLKFSPDSNTPDQIYYQCYTHRYMGWRIRVVDSCSSYLRAMANNNAKRDIRRQGMAFDEDNSRSLNDMLIMNASQNVQPQQMNWTSFEQILKLSPSDLEFLDQHDASLDPLLNNGLNSAMALPLQKFNNPSANRYNVQSTANKTLAANNKTPKTLHSYMRRLASIYYPVQQQLALMLTSQSSPLASTIYPNSSSLSSFVPKPKIDLSKANLGKKLNKFRFKSGRKLEPQSKPPTPANEFNYDIFNNQLAQLEKQQQQFKNLEQQQQTSDLYNYLHLYAPQTQLQPNDEPQAIDSMNMQSSQLFLGNMLNQALLNTMQQPKQYQNADYFNDPRQNQWPYSSTDRDLGVQTRGPQYQQPAVFITRLPIQPIESIRYPNIQPFTTFNQRPQYSPKDVDLFDNSNNNLPAMNTYDSQLKSMQQEPTESLSGSGSRSYYDFRQQPHQQLGKSRLNTDTDHMLAIERNSIQPSTRDRGSSEAMSSRNYNTTTTTPPPTTINNSSQPKRYSSLLIDGHVVASNEHNQGPDISDIDQLMYASDLKRINVSLPYNSNANQRVSGSGSLSSRGSCSGDCERHLTTEPASAVLVRPNSPESYNDPPPTTTMASIGPLRPSLGPPIMPKEHRIKIANNDDELVLRSTLIEPITSTLIEPITSTLTSSSPFIPMDFSHISTGYPQQVATPIAVPIRMRPSPLIESMFDQLSASNKPEPPMQVASYLAQHIASHNPMFVSSERSVTSNQPVAMSVTVSPISGNNSTSSQTANEASNLVILKPAILTKQTPQTYMLKPEYMTNQFQLIGDNSLAQPTGDQDRYFQSEARRLIGHQFDQLSSLSSPPSTSISMDPMQPAHTVTSYSSQQVNANMMQNLTQNNSTESEHHRRVQTPVKSISLIATTDTEPRTNSDPSGNLYKDNNTDNAILSHVMSLISSNAVPTPPLVSISNSDYFLPISDRFQRSIRG